MRRILSGVLVMPSGTRARRPMANATIESAAEQASRKRNVPGGAHGLQTRWAAVDAAGVFDSHLFRPPG